MSFATCHSSKGFNPVHYNSSDRKLGNIIETCLCFFWFDIDPILCYSVQVWFCNPETIWQNIMLLGTIMSPRERIMNALRGKPVDRVPIVLPGLSYRSLKDVQNIADPLRKKIAERAMDRTNFELHLPSYINRMLVTPPQRIRTEQKTSPGGNPRTYGVIDTPLGELTYITEWDSRSQTSWMIKYPVENKKDIEKIASVPWEIPLDLVPPDLNHLPDEFGGRGILITHISSPFVCVSAMMNYEMFLEYCFLDLDLLKYLTEICRQRILDCLRTLLSKPGIDCVWIGGSEWVTPPMAPPEIYDALVQEQERSIIGHVHENTDAVIHVHCHGRIRGALPRMIERGTDYTEPVEPPPDGDITMSEARNISKGRITLGGNIECRILFNGSEDDVESAVRLAFDGGKERFILRPTEGPSPILAEQEFRNYMRMIDVWEELSGC